MDVSGVRCEGAHRYSTGSLRGAMKASFGDGNEPQGTIEGGEFLYNLCNLLGSCQFSSLVARRLQNHILFGPRGKQVAFKPVEGYILFRPSLLACACSHRCQWNNNTNVVQVCGCQIILGQLEWRHLCLHLYPPTWWSQSNSSNMLFTFFLFS
jgi:hypothetical protein